MTSPAATIDKLVIANRILANEGIVDSFGHISVRQPERPKRFLLNRVRAPNLVDANDIMAFTLDGTVLDDARKVYSSARRP
jgi:ribulose-5-phosphate 4-epimerase/fuculose-1-phosphate aldolase